jgi:calcineurin-like phosphoesterase family protein
VDIWFTSDQHFDHKGIIGYCNRPFQTVDEMNHQLIYNHNKLIKSGDQVWHLGDFAWRTHSRFINLLNGQHFLIKGNHDHKTDLKNIVGFSKIERTAQIKVGNQLFWLSHFSHRVWPQSHFGSIHLYGHSHGSLPGLGRSMDVGVDTNGFRPYHLDEILALFKAIPAHEIDHHRS